MSIEITALVNTQARGPIGPAGTNGSDATVTAANTLAAMESMTDAQRRDTREAIKSAEARGIDRLVNYRSAVYNAGAYRRPNILFFGDSMIGTAMTTLRQQVENYGELSGWGLLPGTAGGGATVESDACVKWINGETWLLNGAGQYVEFSYNGASAIEGDILKIYHLQQSGGGNFKIQSSVDGSAFADESGYTSIATAGTTAGVVNTVTKTTYAKTYKIRATWVSGAVNIIGGGIRDSKRFGPITSFITNGSTAINNIDNAKNTARAITDPIFADIAPNLIVLSHLDGAATVTADQGTLQDNIAAGVVSGGAPAPSWLIVGPPIGRDDAQDATNLAQQEAMQTLADSRLDAFYDNRTWALPVSSVISRAIIDGSVHYTTAAQLHWIPSMFRDLGIFDHTIYNRGFVPSLDIIGGGVFRASVSGTPTVTSTETMHMGNMRFQTPVGTTGGGFVYLMDSAGPANNNDWSALQFTSNVFSVNLQNLAGFSMQNNAGQFEFWSFGASGDSRLGTSSFRWGRVFTNGIYLASSTKTGAYTATDRDHLILCDATSGAFTVTLPAVASNTGLVLVIKKIDASGNAVTIDGNASETIDGATTLALPAQWNSARIQSNGSAWYRID